MIFITQNISVNIYKSKFNNVIISLLCEITGFKCTIKPGISYVLDKHVNIDFNLNLLGWYYFNAKMKVIDGNATVAAGTERTISRNGIVLDLLEASPSD